MLNILIYFRLHQPYRLRKLSIFDIGSINTVFDYNMTKSVIEKISDLSYRPTLKLLKNLIIKSEGKFKFSISFSGLLIDQLIEYCPDIIELLKELVETKSVEIVAEPYYNSLSFLYDENEFIYEINKHINLVYSLFNFIPKTFRNTYLIYSNKIADSLRGFTSIKNIITEPAEKVIGFKPPVYLYKAYGKNLQTILLRHQKLSDDLSFNFSNKNWKEFPLTAEKYSKWINDLQFCDKKVKNLYCNLIFDIETFGYYIKEDTGIFEFLYDFPSLILKNGKGKIKFLLPNEIVKEQDQNLEIYSTKEYISMANLSKNLEPFIGNDLQKNSQIALYSLISQAKEMNEQVYLDILRKLSTIDYFHYMSDQFFEENIDYKSISNFPSSSFAYQNFLYILSDIEERLI
ncbi:MAG: hypothetical protein NUV32_06380 [Exilispira sp.]|nr:hypothetical protein [Exilispira sp.]